MAFKICLKVPHWELLFLWIKIYFVVDIVEHSYDDWVYFSSLWKQCVEVCILFMVLISEAVNKA